MEKRKERREKRKERMMEGESEEKRKGRRERKQEQREKTNVYTILRAAGISRAGGELCILILCATGAVAPELWISCLWMER